MRFLISRLSSLGDVVCSLPVASALKAGHPGCEVVWTVDPRFAGIVELCQSVDHTVRAPKGFSHDRVDDRQFEAALDIQGLLKSAWIVARAKAHHKVGYHWQREGSWFFSSKVLPDPSSLHVVDQYVDVARAVGGCAERAEFALAPEPNDSDQLRSKLRAKGWKDSPLVAINAGAGWATKRWTPLGFARVADWLIDQGATPVFLGAPSDLGVWEEVRAHGAENAVSLVGETSIRELVALIAMSQCHIGGDTGSTHIAAALGIPAVGLYTQTRPERSCPYGQIHRCLSSAHGPITVESVQALVAGSLTGA
jgi:ADP-heptose:LPS heptosyltransferase